MARLACGKVRKAQKQIDRERGMELKTSTGDDAQMLEDPSSPTERIRGADYDSGMKNNEESNWFDYPRYVWSTVATMFSIVVVIYGISIKAYVLPVPPVAAYLIAVCMLTVLFYLEGLMIAIVGTQYWDPEQWKDTYPRAYVMHKFVNQPENVKRFIIGRQFFTVLTNFLLVSCLPLLFIPTTTSLNTAPTTTIILTITTTTDTTTTATTTTTITGTSIRVQRLGMRKLQQNYVLHPDQVRTCGSADHPQFRPAPA